MKKAIKLNVFVILVSLIIGLMPVNMVKASDFDLYDEETGEEEVVITGTGLFDDGYGYKAYYIDGVKQDYSGLLKLDNEYYYLINGYWDNTANGSFSDNKNWFVLKDGKLIQSTGLYTEKSYFGESYRYYIIKGFIQTKFTGIKKINGKKYYISKGIVDRNTATIVKYKKNYYVLENGIVKRKVSSRTLKMLKKQKKYPEGKKWTNNNIYRWSQGVIGGGCAGFAFLLNDVAYGKSKGVVTHKKWKSVKSGDIIRLDYDGHSVIVLEKTSKGVVVAEGNYNSSIHWFRYISFKEIKKTGTYVQTRK